MHWLADLIPDSIDAPAPKNKEYFLLKEQNYAAVCDEHFTKEYEVYANEMELLENYKIDGTPLIELINELENIDSV